MIGAGVQLLGGKTRFSRTEAAVDQKHLQLQAAVDQLVESLMSRPLGGIQPKGDRIENHLKESATWQKLNILD